MLEVNKMKKIVFNIIRWNVLPVALIEIILFFFWVTPGMIKTNLASIQLLLVVVFLPIYLAIVNFVLSLKYSKIYWGIKSIAIILSILIATLLGYFGWGIYSEHLFNPDRETIMVVIMEVKFSIITSAVLFVLTSLIAIKITGRKIKNL